MLAARRRRLRRGRSRPGELAALGGGARPHDRGRRTAAARGARAARDAGRARRRPAAIRRARHRPRPGPAPAEPARGGRGVRAGRRGARRRLTSGGGTSGGRANGGAPGGHGGTLRAGRRRRLGDTDPHRRCVRVPERDVHRAGELPRRVRGCREPTSRDVAVRPNQDGTPAPSPAAAANAPSSTASSPMTTTRSGTDGTDGIAGARPAIARASQPAPVKGRAARRHAGPAPTATRLKPSPARSTVDTRPPAVSSQA